MYTEGTNIAKTIEFKQCFNSHKTLHTRILYILASDKITFFVDADVESETIKLSTCH